MKHNQRKRNCASISIVYIITSVIFKPNSNTIAHIVSQFHYHPTSQREPTVLLLKVKQNLT